MTPIQHIAPVMPVQAINATRGMWTKAVEIGR